YGFPTCTGGRAFLFSRSGAVLSALTFVSSRTAARVTVLPPDAGALAACGAAAAGGRTVACCDPMIQPAMSPKRTPAIPNAIASDFISGAISYQLSAVSCQLLRADS